MRDILAFQTAAARYLKCRGCFDQDLLSEMTLHALEHPDTHISVEYAYLHARDRLDPRRRIEGEHRVRQSTRTVALSPAHEAVLEAEDEAPAVDCKLQGPVRAMVLLLTVYGLSMEEVAALFGYTPSRLSQLLGHGKAANAACNAAARITDLLRLHLEAERLKRKG